MNTRSFVMTCLLCGMAAGLSVDSGARAAVLTQPDAPPPREQGAPGSDPRSADDRRPREGRPRRGPDQGQPQREIEAPREGPREGPPRDGRMLKELIDRQLQESARVTQRLEEARKKLDEGTPPEEVFRFLREARGGMLADRFTERWRSNERPEPPKPLFERGPGDGRPSGGPGGGPPLSPEQMDELMVFVREVRPEFAAKLEKWKTEEPRAFRAIVGRLIPKAIDTFRSRTDDKDLFELRKAELRETIYVVEKAHELRRGLMLNKDSGVPNEQKTALRDLMSKAYDARVKVREYEAAHLAKRLDASNKQIQEAKDAKEALLDRALDEVLKGGPGGGPGGGPSGGPARPGRGGEEAEGRPFGDDAKKPLGDRPKKDERPDSDPKPEPPR